MASSKKLIRMATKWKKFEISQKKRISPCEVLENANEDCCTGSTCPSKADRGQFVVYSYDRQRFVIPLHFLNNEIFIRLLDMSEENYGLPRDDPIVLPVDSHLLSYIISVIVQKGLTKDVREALLMSVDMNRCSLLSSNREFPNEH